MKIKNLVGALILGLLLNLSLYTARADGRYPDSANGVEELVGSWHLDGQDVQLVAIQAGNRLTIYHTGGKVVEVETPKDREFNSLGIRVGDEIILFQLDRKVSPRNKGNLSIKPFAVDPAKSDAFLEYSKSIDPKWKPAKVKARNPVNAP